MAATMAGDYSTEADDYFTETGDYSAEGNAFCYVNAMN